MELRTYSKARPAANMAKEDAMGTSLMVETLADTAIILAPAIPQMRWRSGEAFLKGKALRLSSNHFTRNFDFY
jgi:hypothetical protein